MRVWFGYIHRRGGVGWATGRARSRSAWNNAWNIRGTLAWNIVSAAPLPPRLMAIEKVRGNSL